MRVLYLDHPEADYLSAVVFLGLCEELGPENVVDFPLQPHFHGEAWRGPVPYGPGGSMIEGVCSPYTWMPAWPKHDWDEDRVIAGLAEFDLVVLASPRAYNVARLRALFGKFDRNCFRKLVMLDGEDYTAIRWDLIEEFQPSVYFKTSLVPEPLDLYPAQRELMQPKTRVLPCPLTTSFRFVEARKKTVDVSFLGGANWFGTRREGVAEDREPVKPAIEAAIRQRLPDANVVTGHVPYEEYQEIIASSRIAVCVSGHGLEAVRTFEAMGCPDTLVLREAIDQITPWPMVSGEHCLTYSSHEQIADLCEVALRSTDVRSRIARAGNELVWEHYTPRARAKYILEESFR